MRIDFGGPIRLEHHHYNHQTPDNGIQNRLADIQDKLDLILDEQGIIMASLDDLKAAQDATDAKIASVKTDVEALLALLAAVPPAGLTPAQQAALDAAVVHATAINDSLTAVDAETHPTV